jgi:hypothetical protein
LFLANNDILNAKTKMSNDSKTLSQHSSASNSTYCYATTNWTEISAKLKRTTGRVQDQLIVADGRENGGKT